MRLHALPLGQVDGVLAFFFRPASAFPGCARIGLSPLSLSPETILLGQLASRFVALRLCGSLLRDPGFTRGLFGLLMPAALRFLLCGLPLSFLPVAFRLFGPQTNKFSRFGLALHGGDVLFL